MRSANNGAGRTVTGSVAERTHNKRNTTGRPPTSFRDAWHVAFYETRASIRTTRSTRRASAQQRPASRFPPEKPITLSSPCAVPRLVRRYRGGIGRHADRSRPHDLRARRPWRRRPRRERRPGAEGARCHRALRRHRRRHPRGLEAATPRVSGPTAGDGRPLRPAEPTPDGELNASQPEAPSTSRCRDGSMRLVGVEFIVIADDWARPIRRWRPVGGRLPHQRRGCADRYGLPRSTSCTSGPGKAIRKAGFATGIRRRRASASVRSATDSDTTADRPQGRWAVVSCRVRSGAYVSRIGRTAGRHRVAAEPRRPRRSRRDGSRGRRSIRSSRS